MTSVAILGGGVGGLSAAHELAERGFKVDVYELRDSFGGKARSMDVPDTATPGGRHCRASTDSGSSPGSTNTSPTRCSTSRPGRASRSRPSDARNPHPDGSGGQAQRTDRPYGFSGHRSRPRRLGAVHVGLRISAADLTGGGDVLHAADAHTAAVVRRTPKAAVGVVELVGFHRRREAVGEVPEVSRRRDDTNTGRCTGQADVRANGRVDHLADHLRHGQGREPRRQGARRSDQRGVDRSLGRLPARPLHAM